MNTEKLYSICKELQLDFTQNKTVEHLTNLTNALQNVVNSPSDATQQTNLATKIKELENALNKSTVNYFSPAWRQMLEELGGTYLLGLELLETINETFQKNQITPVIALETIKELKQKLSKFKTGVDAIIQGFDTLELEGDELEENYSEIGFLIPRDFIDNDLDNLGKEIHELTFILNALTEFVNGKKESYKIKSISSSDPLITITTETVLWILAFAKIVEWLLDKYKTLLEIKKLRSELKEKGVPDKSLKGIEDHANNYMKNAVSKIVTEIDKNYAGVKDANRRNELKNGLRIGFNKLVNRIDKGYNIEIRISEPDVPQEEDQQTKDQKDKIGLYNQIKNISNKIEFIKVEGESILSLPETNPKTQKVKTTKRITRKTTKLLERNDKDTDDKKNGKK